MSTVEPDVGSREVSSSSSISADRCSTPKKARTTQFIYSPQYPRIGPYQRAFGVFGATKSATIQAVQKAFPGLSQIEANRIDFHLRDGFNDWVYIMDEAWEAFAERGAPYCKIIVKDGPGDEEKRQARSRRRWMRSGLVVVSIAGVLGFISI